VTNRLHAQTRKVLSQTEHCGQLAKQNGRPNCAPAECTATEFSPPWSRRSSDDHPNEDVTLRLVMATSMVDLETALLGILLPCFLPICSKIFSWDPMATLMIQFSSPVSRRCADD
jgi:hypothetical protein